MKKFFAILAIVLVLVGTFSFMILPASAATPLYPVKVRSTMLGYGLGENFAFAITDSAYAPKYSIYDNNANQLSSGIGLSQELVEEFEVDGYLYLTLAGHWSSISINGVTYGTAGLSNDIELGYVTELNITLDSPTTEAPLFRSFHIKIQTSSYEVHQAYNDGLKQGYKDGYATGTNASQEEAFNMGYRQGLEESDSGKLGYNLLGITFSAPINALNQFVLFETHIGDTPIPVTLGGVVGALIAFSLFIAFLKIFAGG